MPRMHEGRAASAAMRNEPPRPRGRCAQTLGGCDCPDHNQDSRWATRLFKVLAFV